MTPQQGVIFDSSGGVIFDSSKIIHICYVLVINELPTGDMRSASPPPKGRGASALPRSKNLSLLDLPIKFFK